MMRFPVSLPSSKDKEHIKGKRKTEKKPQNPTTQSKNIYFHRFLIKDRNSEQKYTALKGKTTQEARAASTPFTEKLQECWPPEGLIVTHSPMHWKPMLSQIFCNFSD